ncbi:septum formation initiator family protein [bacterium]|nr:septum formation initiator family protein [bacterium]
MRLSIYDLLQKPGKVLLFSVCAMTLMLLYDGSFWNLWSLHRNEKEMHKRISALQEDVKSLQFKVEAARSHSFIERQATEQLGLVREDELVFVFSDGE